MVPCARPVVLFQDTDDTAVPPPLAAVTAAQSGAQLVSVPGADLTLPAVVAGQVVVCTGDLFG